MRTKLIEATQAGKPFNWGKFLVGEFDSEWEQPSAMDPSSSRPLLAQCGWGRGSHILVLDMQTGEGAMFSPGGYAKADLDKHRVWVCPMFEPFLAWLYQQDLTDLDALPSLVELDDAPAAMYGYRRRGDGADE